jgi:hypothetical protein
MSTRPCYATTRSGGNLNRIQRRALEQLIGRDEQ